MSPGRKAAGSERLAGAAALAVILAGVALALRPSPPAGAAGPGRWLAVDPAPDDAGDGAALDLRGLNEATAGDGGFLGVRDGRFVHLDTGQPIRFWGVNGPPRQLSGATLRYAARMLARRGVNLVRIHERHFTPDGQPDAARILRSIEVVEALKAEGIYAYLSIYYPLWLTPKLGTPWLAGYDGSQAPFGALFFNPAFQERYRAWWRALLLTPSPRTGRRLADDPAVAGVEIVNEDSLLFPTLRTLPEPQLLMLEARFGAWLAGRHGSIEAALRAWGSPPLPRDAPAAGRAALRPLWQVAEERTARDRDAARFLAETEAAFFADTYGYLRSLGFRGLIGTSNWRTADERVLGPLQKLAAMIGDLMDRHAYLGVAREGPFSLWSLRPGHTYRDRSALRFDGEAGPARELDSPAMDARFGGKPSMLSEVAWERPSRYRAEAPLYLAAYGALQGTDAIVPFRFESERWATTVPGGVATPWPLTSPGQLGQFPAAALIFRAGLVARGAPVTRVTLGRDAVHRLEGTPLPLGAPLSEAEHGRTVRAGPLVPGMRLDPLLHLVGPAEVHLSTGPSSAQIDLAPGLVDTAARVVVSRTRELSLDYGSGLLVIDAPAAQGAVGALRSRPAVETAHLRISSPLETGAVVVVSLDGRSLGESARMLLQVMSEEQATGFRAEPVGDGRLRLVDPGHDPWQVRAIEGSVSLLRPDAAALRVTALDLTGRRREEVGDARHVALLPATFHYLIER